LEKAMTDPISFNRPTLVGREFDYIRDVIARGHLSGNGAFSQRCAALISEIVGGGRSLLTHSCTAALEMAALLCNLEPGDEVIMPSFTFASTANAFVLRGAVPVFIDIRADTRNLDSRLIEAAITRRTRVICAVHYAGVACDMDAIGAIAARHGLRVIEDAAQAMFATWRNRPLGSFGDLAALSFHETKNVISGEGGALVVNDPSLAKRAEIIWEKGTNRAQFARGEVAKYTWVDLGSSFLPSDLTAAFLLAQLEDGPRITERRLAAWDCYHGALAPLEEDGLLCRPFVPPECGHNAHIYAVLAPTPAARDSMLKSLAAEGVNAVMHYVPLHSAPAGLRFGRTPAPLPVTDNIAARLIRLPLHPQITPEAQAHVVGALARAAR
jgi:dTDP-4-amino-4,6-dideoxygalactose transaminase